MRWVAVVLAGGSSRRFGTDKLDAQLNGRGLLDEVVAGLSPDAEIVVVGPERPLPRPVRFVREDPPGGGPAAAMVAGLQAGLVLGADTVTVLPGDAPEAGAAATVLNRVLRELRVAAVVATDADGRVQPLQLALTRAGALQLIGRAGLTAGRNESARRLVETLKPPALHWPLPTVGHFDIDTPEQMQLYRLSRSAPVEEVLAAVDRALSVPGLLVIVGPSGTEKSELAAALALRVPAGVVIHQSEEHTRPELTDRVEVQVRLAAGMTYDIAVGHLRNAASA